MDIVPDHGHESGQFALPLFRHTRDSQHSRSHSGTAENREICRHGTDPMRVQRLLTPSRGMSALEKKRVGSPGDYGDYKCGASETTSEIWINQGRRFEGEL